MALPLIETADVLARLGETEFSDTERVQVESFIKYASGLLRSKVPALDERMQTLSVDRDIVTGSVVNAVVRALDSMRVGLRVRAEQHPEYQATYADAPEDLLFFTAGELAPLMPIAPGIAGAYSVRLG